MCAKTADRTRLFTCSLAWSVCNSGHRVKSTWSTVHSQVAQWHSRLLHGAVVEGVALLCGVNSLCSRDDVLLLAQEVRLQTGHQCTALWDSGSTISLITFDLASRLALDGEACQLSLGGVGANCTVVNTKLYSIGLLDKNGGVYQMHAFGIDRITSPVPALSVPDIADIFPQFPTAAVDRPEAEVELLVGIQEANVHPQRVATRGKLSLFTSNFGTGFILGGSATALGSADETVAHAQLLLLRTPGAAKGFDFLSTESMGTELPRRCRVCLSCKECQFKTHQLTWKENLELSAIEAGLTLDPLACTWTARYPFVQDPSILKNNFNQAVSCMMSQERRLIRNNMLDSFNQQFADTVERGVFRKLDRGEIDAYAGPVNYVSIVEAFKEDPQATTPLRLCVNSSLKFCGVSLNDILVKGPGSINDIFSVMLGFRRYAVGLVVDISKFYQTVLSCERDQHVRRVVWRFGQQKAEPSVYITTRVNFGDKPAGCVAQAALRETARLYNHLSPLAAERIREDSYVDDLVTGAGSEPEAKQLLDDMSKIVSMGGFSFKEAVFSNDHCHPEPVKKVLGTCWHIESDCLSIDTKVNYSEKCKGIRKHADIDLMTLSGADVTLSKRLVWRVTLAQFDLLGLICVFTVRLKLVMRALSTQEGLKLGWDEPIPQDVAANFFRTLQELSDVKRIPFPRSVIPKTRQPDSRPFLVAFADGSQVAICALIYICWPTDSGHVCRLVTGKTRVAPLRKISVPRLELLGAVLAVRLLAKTQEVLRFNFSHRIFLTDSSAALGMIRGESSAMREFVGTRVTEVKLKSDPVGEWYWVPTADNIADLGTRGEARPCDMGLVSDYQCGPSWMVKPVNDWPIKQGVGALPAEELIVAGTVAVARANVALSFINAKKFSSFRKLVRVFMFVCAWRWSFLSKKKVTSLFTAENRKKVTLTLLHHAQQQSQVRSRISEFSSLRPMLKELTGAFDELTLVVVSGRSPKVMAVGYDTEFLPLLPATSCISRSVMYDAHGLDHCGADRSVQRSRQVCWMTQARKVAKSVCSSCFACKRLNKILQGQIMAPLPAHRVPPAPVFHSVAVDLFGPIKIKDSVRRRVSREVYGVIFVCTRTSAVHLDLTNDYSTDMFLLAFRRFISLRGMPARMQSVGSGHSDCQGGFRSREMVP